MSMKALFLSALAVFTFNLFPAFASALVKGNLTLSVSGNYSAVDGHFQIVYTNAQLPEGTRVYLHYGFERGEFHNGLLITEARWNDISDLELLPSAQAEWQGTVSKQLYTRGSSWQLLALQFVFKIILPDGEVIFDKGSESELGYYQANRSVASTSCNPFAVLGCELHPEVVLLNK